MAALELDFDAPDDVPQNYAECPLPGIHHGVSFETYAGWKAINSGVVKWGAISPKHMHAAFNGELKAEDTRSMKLGRALHCMLLEPETFETRFIIAGDCEAVLKSGDRKGMKCGATGRFRDGDGAWMCGKHEPTEPLPLTEDIITLDEAKRCRAANEAIKSHWAVKLIRRKGWSEVSLVWEYAGLPMKCRLDRYATEGTRPTIIDVKKVQPGKGTVEECEYAIKRYGYATQASLYVEGAARLSGKRPEFIWLFVEDGPPHDINIIPASAETLAIGWHIAKSAITRYARAIKSTDIPGYIVVPENIKPGGLPLRDLIEARKAGWLDGESDDSGCGYDGDGVSQLDCVEADSVA